MTEIKGKELITKASAVVRVAESIRRKGIVGVDTEFIRESTFFPKMALIQAATDDEAWLLDPTVLSHADLQPLFDCLVDPAILKVMHAAHSDQECFFSAYGFLAEPVLDTAVAAALTGMGDNLGLSRLMKDLLNVHLPKGRARARWLTRPLAPELLDYAEKDVLHLIALNEKLRARLEAKGRWDWALEESRANRALLELTPDDMAQKMAKSGHLDGSSYGALLELFRWREERARSADLPRSWVCDNETLVALAKSKPKSLDELRHFRGLNHKEVDRQGNVILAAIERGKQGERPDWQRSSRSYEKSEGEEHVLDLLQSYVAYLAAKHEIATRFLLSSSRAPLVLVHSDKSPEQWVQEGILSRNASALIGEDLKALLEGKRGLAIKDRAVEVISL